MNMERIWNKHVIVEYVSTIEPTYFVPDPAPHCDQACARGRDETLKYSETPSGDANRGMRELPHAAASG